MTPAPRVSDRLLGLAAALLGGFAAGLLIGRLVFG